MAYNVELKKKDEKNYLAFNIDGKQLNIDLNSEEQSNLRNLFYEIIKKLFTKKVEFELQVQEDYKEVLYIDIAKDYIKKLNDEIEKVYNNIPEELKKRD